MKIYIIELDDSTSKFFEEVAVIVERPIEELLSDALFKQAEMISHNISKSLAISYKNL